MENKKLSIPFRLKTKVELWDGFGKKQYPQFLIGFGIVVALAVLFSFILHIIIGIFILIVGTVCDVWAVTKSSITNLSIVDDFKILLKKHTEQQKYKYVYRDEFHEFMYEKKPKQE